MRHTTFLSSHGSTSKGPEPRSVLGLPGPYLLTLHKSHLPVPWGFQAKHDAGYMAPRFLLSRYQVRWSFLSPSHGIPVYPRAHFQALNCGLCCLRLPLALVPRGGPHRPSHELILHSGLSSNSTSHPSRMLLPILPTEV